MSGTCERCTTAIPKTGRRFCDLCLRSVRVENGRRNVERRTKHHWNEQSDQYLREHYDPTVLGRVQRVAKALHMPVRAVYERASALGLTRPQPRRAWRPDEETYLRDHAGELAPATIAKDLGRTLGQVVAKMTAMGLSRRVEDGTYSLRSLADCFGVQEQTVGAWVRKGLLGDASRLTRYRSAGLTDRDVLRFVTEHPSAFDLRKVNQLWFMAVIAPAVRNARFRIGGVHEEVSRG